MTKNIWDFPESRKIYYGDTEKVHDRMQIHAHYNGYGFEENE
jgi:hypothetical protein